MQKLANTITGEFNVPPDSALRHFATLGASKGGSTTERDLHRWLERAFGVDLKISFVDITVKNLSRPGTTQIKHPVMMPSTVVKEMWRASPKVFGRCMIGNRGSSFIREYWHRQRFQDWVQQHPFLQDRRLWHKTIPVWVHGDIARIFQQQKLLILSWMSGLVSGCSWSSRVLFSVLPSELLHGHVTLQELLARFAEGLNQLQELGDDVIPFLFAYAASKGDLEWHQMCYRLKRYYRCNLLCSKCFGSQTETELLWTNLLDDASWQATTVKTSEFLSNLRTEVPSLCEVKGWSAETLFWDIMHILFGGVGKDACGSSLTLLMEQRFYSRSDIVDDHLKIFQLRSRTWSSRHGLKANLPLLDHLTLNCPRSVDSCRWFAGWPELELKSAHIKFAIMFLASELERAAIMPVPEVKKDALCMYALAMFLWTLSNADFWLSDRESDEAYHHGIDVDDGGGVQDFIHQQ